MLAWIASGVTEEARRFTEAALRCFAEKNKPLAIGVLLGWMMGLRTGEVLNRVVRDLDDGARYLWIDQGKTVNARRHLEVLALLLVRLADLVAARKAKGDPAN